MNALISKIVGLSFYIFFIQPGQNPTPIPSSNFPTIWYTEDLQSLKSAYQYAKNGDRIVILQDIDLLGKTFVIKKQITLAGTYLPGKQKTKLYSSLPIQGGSLVYVNEDNVVIESLQLDGSAKEITGIACSGKLINGSTIQSFRIIGCELHSWCRAAISIYNGVNATISNCYIYNNDDTNCGDRNWGYGVLIGSKAFATIENNTFDFNRHDIAGGGGPQSGFRAVGNISNNYTSHAFDMHGEAQSCHIPSNDHTAGNLIIIEENLFHNPNEKAVVIRGVPDDRCEIRNNTFAHNWVHNAIEQKIETNRSSTTLKKACQDDPIKDEPEAYGNMRISSNTYTGKPNKRCFQVNYGGVWNRLIGTNSEIERMAFGDFNEDGITDIFMSWGGKFRVSWSALSPWKILNTSNIPIDRLAFGDFNNDGITDVFSSWTKDGIKKWWVSWGGRSGWQALNNYNTDIEELYFDDVDGGGTDVIGWVEEEWKYSPNGSGKWKKLPDGYVTFSWQVERDPHNLHRSTHDFNGDGVPENIFNNPNAPYEGIRLSNN